MCAASLSSQSKTHSVRVSNRRASPRFPSLKSRYSGLDLVSGPATLTSSRKASGGGRPSSVRQFERLPQGSDDPGGVSLTLTLTVHRGTQQIGGSCIEIAHPQGDRPILDAGRPLDAPEGATGLLPASLDRSRPATVLISHPHQDHWGLVEELPSSWPIWTGSGSAKLIAVTGDVMRRPLTRTFEKWDSRSGPFAIGPFTVTPILTDHSAFDAYMLLVEAAGKPLP